jgi:curved DNA-binding protein CbpA
MTDLYEVLQVHPRAEAEVIRAAYRTLARKYHPDHGGDSARMIALNDAWDVLGDPVRRAAYDASLRPAGQVRPAAGSTAAPWASPQPADTRPPDTTIRYDPGAPRPADATHAGPPPGRPSGTVLNFGRYNGWSLGEVVRFDRDYLEWLQRSTVGRGLRAEIDALLNNRGGPGGGAPGSASTSSSRNWPPRR